MKIALMANPLFKLKILKFLRGSLFVCCVSVMGQGAWAGEGGVKSIPFRSLELPSVTPIPPEYRNYEQLFRNGLKTMPEGLLLTSALSVGGRELGLTPEQSQSLTPQISAAYGAIAVDPDFAGVPSALSYGFSTSAPSVGHYFLYRPEVLPENPLCIVFLHGFGGNFQYYTWVLKKEFPQAVILLPSWGMSWYEGSPVYVQDMLKDAERRLGIRLPQPWLMGISAGGRGGFEIYNRMADKFRGFVCIANAPETPTVQTLRHDLTLLMVNGNRDQMVPVAIARQQAALVKSRVPRFSYQEISGDHFFMLSNRSATFELIRRFMETQHP